MTISVITSPSHHLKTLPTSSPVSDTVSNDNQLLRSPNSSYSPNFTRGTYRSSSMNFGSPIRRQQALPNYPILRNGFHHVHHHHHHHLHHPPHSASPSLHSDSSLTPHEDSEFSDGTFGAQRQRNPSNTTTSSTKSLRNEIDNKESLPLSPVSPSSNGTNSIWFEYGCV